MPGPILVLACADYRRGGQSNIERLVRAFTSTSNEVDFVSVALDSPERPSRVERRRGTGGWRTVDGIRCFRWSTPWHPVNTAGTVARWLTAPALDIWSEWPCRDLDAAAARARTIIIQSGPAAALVGRVRRRAPLARIICYADDPAEPAARHPRVNAILKRDHALFDHAVVAARAMLADFEDFGERVSFVPRGLDVETTPVPTPFKAPCNVVVLPSTPFDASVVQIAAHAFPDVGFHLIGTSPRHRYPANVAEHGEKSATETAAFLQHAAFGLTPYADGAGSESLVDTSVGLMQCDHLGIRSVCPWFAVGDKPLRIGYEPGRSGSIREALARASRPPHGRVGVPALPWPEVARAILDRADPTRTVAHRAPRRREREAVHGR